MNRQTKCQTAPRIGGKGGFRLNPDFPLIGGFQRVLSRDNRKPCPNISVSWALVAKPAPVTALRRGIEMAGGL